MTSQKKLRLIDIDMAKGIAIFLVVLGHVVPSACDWGPGGRATANGAVGSAPDPPGSARIAKWAPDREGRRASCSCSGGSRPPGKFVWRTLALRGVPINRSPRKRARFPPDLAFISRRFGGLRRRALRSRARTRRRLVTTRC